METGKTYEEIMEEYMAALDCKLAQLFHQNKMMTEFLVKTEKEMASLFENIEAEGKQNAKSECIRSE